MLCAQIHSFAPNTCLLCQNTCFCATGIPLPATLPDSTPPAPGLKSSNKSATQHLLFGARTPCVRSTGVHGAGTTRSTRHKPNTPPRQSLLCGQAPPPFVLSRVPSLPPRQQHVGAARQKCHTTVVAPTTVICYPPRAYTKLTFAIFLHNGNLNVVGPRAPAEEASVEKKRNGNTYTHEHLFLPKIKRKRGSNDAGRTPGQGCHQTSFCYSNMNVPLVPAKAQASTTLSPCLRLYR